MGCGSAKYGNDATTGRIIHVDCRGGKSHFRAFNLFSGTIWLSLRLLTFKNLHKPPKDLDSNNSMVLHILMISGNDATESSNCSLSTSRRRKQSKLFISSDSLHRWWPRHFRLSTNHGESQASDPARRNSPFSGKRDLKFRPYRSNCSVRGPKPCC